MKKKEIEKLKEILHEFAHQINIMECGLPLGWDTDIWEKIEDFDK